MSLKTATVIALIGVLIESVLWLCNTFGVISFSTPLSRQIYSIANLILGKGTLGLFFAVLYSNQKSKQGVKNAR